MNHGGKRPHRKRRRHDSDPRVLRTRTKVLDAARELLQEEGPDAVTALRISERTGVARTTIYRHWPTRSALLADAIGEDAPRAIDQASDDVRADLMQILTRISRRMSSRPGRAGLGALMAHAHHEPELADLRRRSAASRMAPLVALLDAHVEAGRLAADLDTDACVAQLVGPILFQRFFRGEQIDDTFIAAIVDAFLRSAQPD